MRWTARRKEGIIVAIENGVISPAEAQRQNGLSDEELAAWRRVRHLWPAGAPRHKAPAAASPPQKKDRGCVTNPGQFAGG